MEKTIKSFIQYDGSHYCARCVEVDVFTQGKTIDETIKNLQEAVSLHLEGVSPSRYGLGKNPVLLIMMESAISASHA